MAFLLSTTLASEAALLHLSPLSPYSFSLFAFNFEPHSVVFRGYSYLCIEKLQLAGSEIVGCGELNPDRLHAG